MNDLAERIDLFARKALADELALTLKPGLVTPQSNGSHDDMDHRSFEASIESLEGYFADCVRMGSAGVGLGVLKHRGIAAEKCMFAATGGINTHKGAIFTLGLLCAAAGAQLSRHGAIAPEQTGDLIARTWGGEILLPHIGAGCEATSTHGSAVRFAFGLPGAREQAADGFPVLFATTLPQLRLAIRCGVDRERAGLHALLATIAVLPDTNLAYRGGIEGLRWARRRARQFLAAGSIFDPAWRRSLSTLCDTFEARNLSPGGSADLLAAAFLLQHLEGLPGLPQVADITPVPQGAPA